MVEFPFYQTVVAFLFKVFGESILVARITNVIVFSIGISYFYLLVKYFSNHYFALLASLLLSFFPTAFFWARAITPDIFGLVGLIGSFYFLTDKRIKYFYLKSALLLTIAVLTKPFYFVFIFTHYFFITNLNENETNNKIFHKKYILKTIKLYLLPLTFFLLWRLWFFTFPPEARAESYFLELMHNKIGYINFWKQTNWFSFFLKYRFMGELLTPFGGALSILGAITICINIKNKFKNVILSCIIASVSICIIFSAGSFWHDYYALHWLPICAILSAIGISSMFKHINSSSAHGTIFAILFIILFYYFGYLPFLVHKNNYFKNAAFYSDALVKDYMSMRRIIPQNEKVLFLLPDYTPQPLNEVRRFGFTSDYSTICSDGFDFYDEISRFISLGAKIGSIYIEPNAKLDCLSAKYPDLINEIDKNSIFKGNGFWLFPLQAVVPNTS